MQDTEAREGTHISKAAAIRHLTRGNRVTMIRYASLNSATGELVESSSGLVGVSRYPESHTSSRITFSGGSALTFDGNDTRVSVIGDAIRVEKLDDRGQVWVVMEYVVATV